MSYPNIVAIDGPAASGKTTVANKLAEKWGYLFFDTGVMYRAVTWAALDRGIPVEDEVAVTALAEVLRIQVIQPTVDDGRQYTVLADGQDVTWAIRTPEVNKGVSPVSAYSGVRTVLSAQQRRIGHRGKIVMVGRDIGTVVLPDADLKVYLEASVEARAVRRCQEIEGWGEHADYEESLASLRRRDKIDSGRAIAPLRPAPDAVVIDTTDLSIDQVLEQVFALADGWQAPEE